MAAFSPVSLIGVPTDVGAGHRGARLGPEALRIAGLPEALAARGVDVRDIGNLDGPRNPWLPGGKSWGPVIAGAIRQFWSETSWGPIDYLLVDMPPGTGDVALTVFQSLPVDGIVIVTSPQDLVSMIVAKAVNMAEKMNVPILGIVENMSYIECPDCGKKIEVFGKSKLPEVAERYNLEILGQLPINPALAEACDKGEVETALPDGMLPKAVFAVEAITPHETDEA